MTSSFCNAVHWLEQYEALRQEALRADPFGQRGPGIALLISRGMMAWMMALAALGRHQPASPVAGPLATSGMPGWPSFPASDLTHVLADMVLTCSQEVIR